MNLLLNLTFLAKQVVKTEISKMKLKNAPHKKCSRHRHMQPALTLLRESVGWREIPRQSVS